MKAWDNLKENLPTIAVLGGILISVWVFYFNHAVDERIAAAGLITPAHMAEMKADIKALQNELHEGRTAGDIEANKEAIGRIEAGVVQIQTQFNQLLIALQN